VLALDDVHHQLPDPSLTLVYGRCHVPDQCRPRTGCAVHAVLRDGVELAFPDRCQAELAGDDPARAAHRSRGAAGDPDDRFFQATGAARSYAARVDIQFIASIAVITPNPQKSRELFIDALGLPLEASPGSDYFHSERVEGSKHFGVWPLAEAAQACFGTADWPADRTVPQMSLEFEVGDADAVESAAEELRQQGFTLLHDRREEPWGQTVARLQSEEGSIIGISFAPSLHD
jgi:catechol 2,3-dioxygenase-like lactoylglutathione lyase family enzyme